MAVPPISTWNLAAPAGGPRRPSLDDVGSAALQDDAENPPVAPIMPNAAQLNQLQYQAAAAGHVLPALVISVRYAAGVPFVYKFTYPGDNLLVGQFTVTAGVAGEVTIAWPANIFPVSVAEPVIGLNGSTRGFCTAEYVAGNLHVRTTSTADANTNLPFTVILF